MISKWAIWYLVWTTCSFPLLKGDDIIVDADTKNSSSKEKHVYPLPDLYAQLYKDSEWFHFRSIQTSQINGQIKGDKFMVDEWFSFSLGLSYSLHKRIGATEESFAYILDGRNNRAYVFWRTPSDDDFEDSECDLDTRHNHKKLFPWQYKYSYISRTRMGKVNPVETSIFGVGAIWLNMMQMKVESEEVGDNSPYTTSDRWIYEKDGIKVELLFKKSPDENFDVDKLIADSFYITRERHYDSQTSSDIKTVDTTSLIHIEKYDVEMADSVMSMIQRQVRKCKQDTRSQKAFPSLLHEINLSGSRHYSIEYVLHNYEYDATERLNNADKHGDVDENHSDDAPQTFLPEKSLYYEEWFSYELGSQVTIVSDLKGMQNDYQYKYFHNNQQYHVMREWNQFTENTEKCVKEAEPPQRYHNHLLRKRLHFRDSSNLNTETVGLLTGLGALLMNVVDLDHKRFKINQAKFVDRIKVNKEDDEDTNDGQREVVPEEWIIDVPKSNQRIHFYFELMLPAGVKGSRRTYAQLQPKLHDLIRVVISKLRPPIEDLDSSDRVDRDEGIYDVLRRYEILGFSTEADSQSDLMIFKLPIICEDAAEPHMDDDDHDDHDDEDHDDDDDEYYDADDDDYSEGSSDGHTDDDDFGDLIYQDEIESNWNFPDFLELLDFVGEYKIETKITNTKHYGDDHDNLIDLVEYVSLDRYRSRFDLALDGGKRHERFYINYNNGLIFNFVDGSKKNPEGECSVVPSMEPWFRLLSAEYTYEQTLLDSTTIKSQDLRMYGVGALLIEASRSPYVRYQGSGEVEHPDKHLDDDERYDKLHPTYSWSMHDDADNDFLVRFHFQWGHLEDEIANQDKKAEMHLKHRRHLGEPKMIPHTINIEPDLSDLDDSTRYESFTLFPKITRLAESQTDGPESVFRIPDVCERAGHDFLQTDEGKSHLKNKLKAKFPRLDDLIKESQSYTFKYEILVVSAAGKFERKYVTEMYDRNARRGRMEVQNSLGLVTYFIVNGNENSYSVDNGNLDDQDTIGKFAYDRQINKCGKFEEFTDDGLMVLWNTVQKYKDSISDKIYEDTIMGLGAIWDEASKRFKDNKPPKIAPYIDSSGKKRAHYTWTMLTEGNHYMVHFTFDAQISQSGDLALRLSSIVIMPSIRDKDSMREHHIQIVVRSFIPHLIDRQMLELPPACKELATKPKKFPSMEAAMRGRSESLHMRSEVTLSSTKVSERASSTASKARETNLVRLNEITELIDFEYKMIRLVRLPTDRDSQLGSHIIPKQPASLLIYGTYDEVFDIEGYNCHLLNNQKEILSFWFEQSILSHPSRQYYGAASLWHLAQKPDMDRKPYNRLNLLGAIVKLNESPWLDSEVWRISPKVTTESVSKDPAWYYDMYFRRSTTAELAGQNKSIHDPDMELVMIKLYDNTNGGDVMSMSEVYIDVIKYEFGIKNEDEIRYLILPEGSACKRGTRFYSRQFIKYETGLNRYEHFQLAFEASFLTAANYDQQSKQQTYKMHRVINGIIAQTSLRMQDDSMKGITVLSQRYKKPDGSTSSTKIVWGGSRGSSYSMRYNIDERSGACSYEKWKPNNRPALDFDEGARLDLNDEIYQLFLMDGDKFQQLNKYLVDTLMITVFERDYDNFKLSDEIQGPASVLKTFTETHLDTRDLNETEFSPGKRQIFHSITVKVIIFKTLERKDIIAQLTMHIHELDKVDKTTILERADISACFKEKGQTMPMSLEFDLSLEPAIMIETNREMAKEAALERLILVPDVDPLQINQLDVVVEKQTMLIKFVMLDKLSPRYYYNKLIGNELADNERILADSRLFDNEEQCSRWCDSIRCVAFTYCGDRICAAMNMASLSKSNWGMSKEPAKLQQGPEVLRNIDCTTYYVTISSSSTGIKEMIDYMNYAVNGDKSDQSNGPAMLEAEKKVKDPDEPYDIDDLESESLRPARDNMLEFWVSINEKGSYFRNVRLRPIRFSYEPNELEAFFEDDETIEDEDPIGSSTAITDPSDIGKKGSKRRAPNNAAYRIIKRDRAFQLSKLKVLKLEQEKLGVKIEYKSMFLTNGTVHSCETFCLQFSCLLYSLDEYICIVVHDVQDLQLVQMQGTNDMPGAIIVMRNYLNEYQQFENTRFPTSQMKMVASVNLLECAFLCKETKKAIKLKINDQNQGDQNEAAPKDLEEEVVNECLSFDYCQTKNDKEEAQCYLQSSHVVLTNMDLSILSAPTNPNQMRPLATESKDKWQCSHYSRSLIADYSQISGKSIGNKPTSTMVYQGIDSQKCALLCSKNDLCDAFEYCYYHDKHPSHSCYIHDKLQTQSLQELQNISLEDKRMLLLSLVLTDSKDCSVFKLRHKKEASIYGNNDAIAMETDGGEDIVNPSSCNDSGSFFAGAIKLLFLGLLGLLLGLVVRFGWSKWVQRLL